MSTVFVARIIDAEESIRVFKHRPTRAEVISFLLAEAGHDPADKELAVIFNKQLGIAIEQHEVIEI